MIYPMKTDIHKPWPERTRVIHDITAHIILTVIFSLLVYLRTGNPFYVFLAVVGGIFIDLDHFLDHFLFFKNRFNISEFMGLVFLNSGKVYLFLHSWEINICLLGLSLFFKSPAWFVFSLSLAIHLGVDNIQRRRPLFYFLSYRISKGFDAAFLLPEVELPVSRYA